MGKLSTSKLAEDSHHATRIYVIRRYSLRALAF
jgi:hypothetical protein